MSINVIPNSGIMGDDRLDRLRGEALRQHQEQPLPEAVVYYLRALESLYADHKAAQRKSQLHEIGWKLATTQGPQP